MRIILITTSVHSKNLNVYDIIYKHTSICSIKGSQTECSVYMYSHAFVQNVFASGT